jgi:hypothetical protein
MTSADSRLCSRTSSRSVSRLALSCGLSVCVPMSLSAFSMHGVSVLGRTRGVFVALHSWMWNTAHIHIRLTPKVFQAPKNLSWRGSWEGMPSPSAFAEWQRVYPYEQQCRNPHTNMEGTRSLSKSCWGQVEALRNIRFTVELGIWKPRGYFTNVTRFYSCQMATLASTTMAR